MVRSCWPCSRHWPRPPDLTLTTRLGASCNGPIPAPTRPMEMANSTSAMRPPRLSPTSARASHPSMLAGPEPMTLAMAALCASPIALIDDGASDAQAAEHAHLASRVTHANPRCQVACALYVLVARHLLDGAERGTALESSVGSLREVYAVSEPWSAELLPSLELLLDRRSKSGMARATCWTRSGAPGTRSWGR